MTISLRNLPADELFLGHKACGGCGGSLVVRWTLKVLGSRAFVVMPAGCMAAVGFIYPQMALGVNAIIAPFAATGAVLSGIAAAVRAKGMQDVHVVGFAGDGGTADIGLQSLSGALDRRDKIIYICYDNEAYMNTGVQKSGATPWGVRTTTSPQGFRPPAGESPKKDLLRIAAAHGIPYAATASVGHPTDFLRKIEKAGQVDGPSFLHVFAPCPTGWGCDSDATIRLGKSVVDTGLWPLVEWEQGRARISRNFDEFADLSTYFDGQGRFKTLTPKDMAAIERTRDQAWRSLRGWVRETSGA